MSGAKVWLTRGLAEHVRSVLEPMVEHYKAQASAVGSDPGRQVERAHHVGRAQGLIDAVDALTSSAAQPVVEPGLVTADVVRRMRRNSGGAHRGPR